MFSYQNHILNIVEKVAIQIILFVDIKLPTNFVCCKSGIFYINLALMRHAYNKISISDAIKTDIKY